MLLVTGITGHTGKYFLQELINNNYGGLIRCIVRDSSDTTMIDNCKLNIEKVVGDIEDSLFMENAMKDVDVILHIAGIQKTLCVIRAATLNKVTTGIFVHTTGIYSKFKSASDEYLKIENEIHVINNAIANPISIIILRPTMIYGDLCDLNMSKFIKMVDRWRFFPVINRGEGLIQPVNARDLGKAYYQVLTTPHNKLKAEYIVSGHKPITMLDAFKMISDKLKKKTFFVSCPLKIGVLAARILRFITLNRLDFVEKVQRMGEDRSFPHDDASNDFNYCPRSFEEGIEMEVGQYIKKKKG